MRKGAYEPSQLAMENRELRRRREQRDLDRANARQADKDKAAKLRADCQVLCRLPLIILPRKQAIRCECKRIWMLVPGKRDCCPGCRRRAHAAV